MSNEPYQPATELQTNRDEQPSGRQRNGKLFLPIAMAIIALLWILVTVPGMVAPLTLVHFMSMQLGPPVCALLLGIWWLLSRGLTVKTRWVGFALTVVTFVVAASFSDPTSRIILLVYGLGAALTVLVGFLWLTKGVSWPKRGWIAWAGYAVFLVTLLFLRADAVDANFAFKLVPRWQPTAEEEFLSSLQNRTEPTGVLMEAAPIGEVSPADWAEFRGPNRDGTISGVKFSTDWESQPPIEIWRRDVGPAWSSMCVVGPWLFTQEQRGDVEVVAAYSANDGTPIWTNETENRFEASMGGVGPRATPTFDAGLLYTTGGSGLVQCLDAQTGDSIWEYDLVNDFGAAMPAWGFASSPLVVDDVVIVFAGGGQDKGVAALNRQTGELAWSAEDGSHGYSSPQLSKIAGVAQVLISSNRGVSSLNPMNGSTLWFHDWDIGEFPRVTQPLVEGNQVFIGTGYGNGTQRIDIAFENDSWSVDERWTAPLKPYFNDFVHFEGHLYGFDGPIFMSVDAETGEKNWKRGRYGHGQVLLVRDMATLVVLTEKGDLILVSADPTTHNEVTRIPSMEGITWNHPVIVEDKLYVRNVKEMVCYRLNANNAIPQVPDSE